MTTSSIAGWRLLAVLAVMTGTMAAGADGRPVSVSGQAAAPDPPPGRANRAAGSAPGDNLPPVTTGELVNMLDTYAIVKAQDELTLNDTQYGQFVTRLKRLQDVRRR